MTVRGDTPISVELSSGICRRCGGAHSELVHTDHRAAAVVSVSASLRAIRAERRGDDADAAHAHADATMWAAQARLLYRRGGR